MNRLQTMLANVARRERMLGDINAVASDGDHGRGLVRGLRPACQAVAEQHLGAGGASWTAGMAWADNGGGPSGVLWGARIGDQMWPGALLSFVAVFEGGTATNAPRQTP
ncbi:MAG TPA: DAK2 domain-containing protein, partial [Micromonosporaceae bacterium]|nr:DAK2 domain-containing protein [Micromonosporaceae bacterium]